MSTQSIKETQRITTKISAINWNW